jgi:2-C-methyl-D-erythritol 4-phosphate cytidylyltransferase
MYVSALIVAAGKGSRMKIEQNKIFLEIRGKEIITRTIDVFENHVQIDEIVVVVNESDKDKLKEKYINSDNYKKVKKIVAGGAERQDSVENGLKALAENSDIVLIHDGARPFIEDTLIKKSIDAAKTHGAACLAVPVKDTIKKVDMDGFVDETLNRSRLWAVQTPQSFRIEVIKKAHEYAKKEGYLGTDDTFLVEKMGEKVILVPSSYDNIKVTTFEDIKLAENIAEKMDNSDRCYL